MFLDNQIKQRKEIEQVKKEQTKQDFNEMINKVGKFEKEQSFKVSFILYLKSDRNSFVLFRMKWSVNKLTEMNQEILKQHEFKSDAKSKQHKNELQIELDNALKDKRFYEIYKASEHLNKVKSKDDRLKEIQSQIEMKQKLN